MKNISLGVKIGLGFGVLILLICSLGGLAIINMQQVRNESAILTQEYVPEVKVSNQLERASFNTMHNIRGYALSENTAENIAYLEAGRGHLAQIKQYLQEAKTLTDQSAHLVKLREAIEPMAANVTEYETLVQEMEVKKTLINEQRDRMDAAAVLFLQNCRKFLDRQEALLKEEIAAGATVTALNDRVFKLVRMNKVLDTGNDIRITNFKAQARQQPGAMQPAFELFTELNAALDEVKGVSRRTEHLEAIDEIRTAAAGYEQAMRTLLDNWNALEQLKQQRETLASEVLAEAQEIAEKGIEETLVIADDTQALLISSTNVLIGGLIAAALIGIGFAVFMTHSITQPLTKIVNTAAAIVRGDFSQEIEIQQRDEIGQLADAFRSLRGKIQEVLQETSGLIQAVQQGRLDQRGNTEPFEGSWRELVGGINGVIDAFVTPIMQTAEYLDRIAHGAIPEPITTKAQGDFNEIQNNLNQSITAINGLMTEISRLTEAAVAGDLRTRGSAAKFQGDFARIVSGMNATLDAVITPLNAAAEYVDRISKGDIPDKITDDYKGDFNQIKANLNLLIEAMEEITRLAETMADGDLTLEVQERSQHDKLMQALNTMLERLNAIVSDVKGASDNVASSSQAMSSSAEELSEGATEQAAAAEEASSSMEQMSANIRQNADNALQTEKIAIKASEDAREGGQAVAQTVAAMQEIVRKVSIIEEIARQTHMLSLNATIEAAKAQEYGKGFSVVASEVRSLAERAQTAAVEINTVANNSIGVAEKAGTMLDRLVPDIQRTAELVQEISAATNEQHTGTKQINKAIQQLDDVIQQNAAASEEAASTSEELSSQAEMLQQTVSFFNVKARQQALEAAPGQPAGKQKGLRVAHLTPGKHGPDTADQTTSNDNGRDPAGKMLDIRTPNEAGDEHDAEFERY